jgi:hypothetical protein
MINQRFGQGVSNLSTVAELRTFDGMSTVTEWIYDISVRIGALCQRIPYELMISQFRLDGAVCQRIPEELMISLFRLALYVYCYRMNL